MFLGIPWNIWGALVCVVLLAFWGRSKLRQGHTGGTGASAPSNSNTPNTVSASSSSPGTQVFASVRVSPLRSFYIELYYLVWTVIGAVVGWILGYGISYIPNYMPWIAIATASIGGMFGLVWAYKRTDRRYYIELEYLALIGLGAGIGWGVGYGLSLIAFSLFWVSMIVMVAGIVGGFVWARTTIDGFTGRFTVTVSASEQMVVCRERGAEYIEYVILQGDFWEKLGAYVLYLFGQESECLQVVGCLTEGVWFYMPLPNTPFFPQEKVRHFRPSGQPIVLTEIPKDWSAVTGEDLPYFILRNFLIRGTERVVNGKKEVDLDVCDMAVGLILRMKSLDLRKAWHLRSILQQLKDLFYTRDKNGNPMQITEAARQTAFGFLGPIVTNILKDQVTLNGAYTDLKSIFDSLSQRDAQGKVAGLQAAVQKALDAVITDLGAADYLEIEVTLFVSVTKEGLSAEIKQNKLAAELKVAEAQQQIDAKEAETKSIVADKETESLEKVAKRQAAAEALRAAAAQAGNLKVLETYVKALESVKGNPEAARALGLMALLNQQGGDGRVNLFMNQGSGGMDSTITAAQILADVLERNKAGAGTASDPAAVSADKPEGKKPWKKK